MYNLLKFGVSSNEMQGNGNMQIKSFFVVGHFKKIWVINHILDTYRTEKYFNYYQIQMYIYIFRKSEILINQNSYVYMIGQN